MFVHRLLAVLLSSLALVACETGPDSPRGFSLPKGDVARGEQVFRYTGCLSCHAIKGIESDIKIELDKPVLLGGKVTRIKTYGELVTSVINPSHKVAKSYRTEGAPLQEQSPMRNYNDTLTVSQLVDLVTFLESKYELVAYQSTRYGTYYP